MKKIICCLVAAVLCFGLLCGTASATEIDFSNVDWDSIEWDDSALTALDNWIYGQEDLNKLFALYGHLPESNYSWIITMAKRLLEDPAAFMRALAEEDAEMQTILSDHITSSIYHELAPGYAEFPDAIYSTTLSETDTAETRYVLSLFESAVEKYWGIPNPKTGDPVGIAVAVMTVCGFGGAALLRKKRMYIQNNRE